MKFRIDNDFFHQKIKSSKPYHMFAFFGLVIRVPELGGKKKSLSESKKGVPLPF